MGMRENKFQSSEKNCVNRGNPTLRRKLNVRLHSKGLVTIKQLTRVGGLTLRGVFTRQNVLSPTR